MVEQLPEPAPVPVLLVLLPVEVVHIPEQVPGRPPVVLMLAGLPELMLLPLQPVRDYLQAGYIFFLHLLQ
ncbi:hypothetical protein D3C72_1266510 [compost metagenome]